MRNIKNKTNSMLRLEREYNTSIEELLRSMYVDQNMTIKDIANELILSVGIVFRWMNMANISTRKIKFKED